jgi:Fungal specific transcription factor domain
MSLRRISDTELFLLTDDPGVEQDAREVDRIQALVQGCSDHLMKLYFRIVHPSFPVLHKGLFLEKLQRSIYEISPPLLAAVYLLALNWRNYSSSTLPMIDEAALSEIAYSTFSGICSRPRLSTVQAGLLLLQRRHIDRGGLSDGPGVGAFVGQLCAVGRVLGLHLDCTDWRIPGWEKGLRRRLGWALWMCDKWCGLFALVILNCRTALHLSLSPFLPLKTWQVPMVTEDDFPEGEEDDDDEEGSVVVTEGREGFVNALELSRILGDILERYPNAVNAELILSLETRHDDVPGAISVGRPFLARLEAWRLSLPKELDMGSTRLRKLCSNGL